MYKVLIVEDMDLVREDVEHLLDWERMGLILLPSARNGKMGFEAAMRYQADIIITDIKMPIKNGLEMIEELQKAGLEAKYILLTAYGEFELAKKAVELGVNSFLMKYELEESVLLREVCKCTDALEKSRKLQHDTMKHRLEKLLSGEQKEEYISSSFFRWLGKSSLIDISYMGTNVPELSEENLQDLLEELLDCPFTLLWISSREYMLFLRQPEGISEREMEQLLDGQIHRIQEFFVQEYQAETAVAIGGSIRSSKDIRQAADRAQACKALRIFYRRSCVLRQPPQEMCDSSEMDQILEKIENALAENEYAAAGEKIRELFLRKIVWYKNLSLLSGAVTKLSFYFRKKGYEEKAEKMEETLEHIRRNHLQWSIYQTAQEFLNLLTMLDGLQESRYSRKVRNAMAYVRKNYQREITLNEISEKLDMSPIYFSHLFKRETGDTFSAYLTSVRIEKAKELLLEGEKKIYEISELVGYQTVQYFSKVFKKETGKNPTEFKK